MSQQKRQGSQITDQIDISQRQKSMQLQITPQPVQRVQNLTSLTMKVCTLCLSSFYFGYCLVYLSTLSRTAMIRQFGYQSEQASIHGLLYGLLTVGGAVGACVSPFLMRKYTRRYLFTQQRNLMVLLNCGALIVEGALQYPSMNFLFVCRAFQGFFMGNFIGLLPAYISELSPKQVVGSFKVFNQLFFVSGILFAYALGTILTKAGVDDHFIWRMMFGFNIIMIIFVLLNCIFKIIPESPKSYIRKGLKDKAKKVIGLFVKPQYVDDVFKQKLIEVNNQFHTRIVNTEQLSSYSRKAYFIGFLLPIMQPLTGINTIITQIGFVLQNHHFQFGYYVPLIICFVQFWAIFGSIYTSRQFGRRTVLLSGSFGLAICDIIIGICFSYSDQFPDSLWIVFVVLNVYMVIYGLTLGPVVWMYIPEIIPASVVPFAATINCISSSFCLMLSPIVNSAYGTPTVYFCFGGITLIVTLINAFGMVESKDRTASQVKKSFFEQGILKNIQQGVKQRKTI